MKNEPTRRPVKRSLFLAMMLLATVLATASQWEPTAQARRCCSTCPVDPENSCWNFCALSC